MVKNSQYWENRVAKKTWQTYNDLEERNWALFEMYQEASGNISNELYKVAERINGGKAVSLTDMHKFNRLMGLKKSFEKTIRELVEQTEEFAKENMQQGFKDTYKAARTAISSTAFTMPDKRLMDEMLDRPWRGDSFSSRLWKNTSILANNLNESLVIGLQQGKTISEISIKMANDMMQGFNVTHRLVRTETMHYLNNSAVRAYKDAGIEYVQIWAAEDERTCKHCMQYHEKIYPIDKAPILPIHAHCRCTYLPVTDKSLIPAQPVERNTFKRVEYNSQGDYSIKLSGYNKTVNKGLSEAAENVARLGSKDNKEHLHLINLRTGEKIFYCAGEYSAVGGPEFWKFIDANKQTEIAFIHNHNTDSFFSETDIKTLLICENISAMIAVRNDGVKYIAKKKKGVSAVTSRLDELYKDDIEALNNKVKQGIIPMEDRAVLREELIVNNALRDFVEEGIEFDGREK
ncbi:minor capsid protein [Aminipila sp.]|uniref:minor capsid protein n=1 Tax=Aminipila sp. TaxID=2060095 RepID=UPI00289DF332|nr:minor capsid protein [Aminipila sp.]